MIEEKGRGKERGEGRRKEKKTEDRRGLGGNSANKVLVLQS